MSDEPIVIKIEGEDTQGHAAASRWTSDDESWIKELSDSAKPVRIRIPADDDTEGHVASSAVTVVVSTDDDDTEGHAISLHFPSVQEANDFRKRLMAAGLITATIAVGAAGGMALGTGASGNAAGDVGAASQLQASNLGQYDVDNMGGTAASELQASNLGQYDVDNMGGTAASELQATSNQGQYDTANMGGTPQAPADDEVEPPFTPNRTSPR